MSQFTKMSFKSYKLPRIYCRISRRLMSTVPQRHIVRQEFEKGLPKTLNSFASAIKVPGIPETTDWMRKLLNYNLLNVKLKIGFVAPLTYKLVELPENITDESMELAKVLGCCCEMLQIGHILVDDLIDQSDFRNNVPCWYKIPEVGVRVANDALTLLAATYQILSDNFSDKPYFADLVKLFSHTIVNVSVGQHVDYEVGNRKVKDFNTFTQKLYDTIARQKSGPGLFNFSVQSGLILANQGDKETLKQASDICTDLAVYFQVQNDYLDVFGAFSGTGQDVGIDISDGKCSWPAVRALELCDTDQRRLFNQCYGQRDPEKIAAIVNLFKDLRIDEEFRKTEKQMHQDLIAKIRNVTAKRTHAVFFELLDLLYRKDVLEY